MTCILLLVQQLEANNPVAFISKTKHFLSTFFCIFQIHIKFWTFSKKGDPTAYVFLKLPPPKDALS